MQRLTLTAYHPALNQNIPGLPFPPLQHCQPLPFTVLTSYPHLPHLTSLPYIPIFHAIQQQVPVYTSFATPAAIGVHCTSMVMAFGGAINFYRY